MKIPEQAKSLVNEQPLMYLATVDEAGWPNVVPMLQYWWHSGGALVVGDLFMKKTVANVKETGKVSFSLTNDKTGASFKFKGTATYSTEGPEYDFANEKLHAKSPDKNFKGCVAIKVCAVYNAGKGAVAGEHLAGEEI